MDSTDSSSTPKKDDFLGLDKTTWALAAGGVALIISGAIAMKTLGDMQKMGQLPPLGLPNQQQLIEQQQAQMAPDNGRVTEIEAEPEPEMTARDAYGQPAPEMSEEGVRTIPTRRGVSPFNRINV
jgi:hypothetical protein